MGNRPIGHLAHGRYRFRRLVCRSGTDVHPSPYVRHLGGRYGDDGQMSELTWVTHECQGQAVAKCVTCGRNAPAKYVGTLTPCAGCSDDQSKADSDSRWRTVAAEHHAYWSVRQPLGLGDLAFAIIL